ncbi:ATP-binding cassette domain-containing protein [Oscillospiraceae bacterium MB08-C2-2]|nr:ATP-binding cassette domain-containing protein [Oscillospiraceae bacterium MB08-C2-2]
MEQWALEFENISRRINSEFYLTDINLKIAPGQVHAFVGKNAAGKSSLFKTLVGIFPPDRGSLYVFGKKSRIASPVEAKALGITLIAQNSEMFENLSVCENMFMNTPDFTSGKLGLIDRKGMRAKAARVFQDMGVSINPDSPVSQLSRSEKQLMMIASALVGDSKIILLDETSTHLSQEECEVLNDSINAMKAKGITFLLVSHRLDQILAVSDAISVMERGAVIRTAPVSEFSFALLTELITGYSVEDLYHKPPVEWGEPVLELEGVSGPGFADISLKILSGQIVAVVGRHSSGKQQLARLLGGFESAKGSMRIDGKPITSPTIMEAMLAGVSYSQSSRDDWVITWLDRYMESHPVQTKAQQVKAQVALWWAVSAKSLSNMMAGFMRFNERNNATGGYIQRELTNKALDRRAKLYILCEPTAGLDVSAKMGVYARLGDKIQQGSSVLLVTSDFEEAKGMADCIVFMEEGRITRQIQRQDPQWDQLRAH